MKLVEVDRGKLASLRSMAKDLLADCVFCILWIGPFFVFFGFGIDRAARGVALGWLLVAAATLWFLGGVVAVMLFVSGAVKLHWPWGQK